MTHEPTFDPAAPIVPPVRRRGRRRLAAAAAAGSLAVVGVAGLVVGASDGGGPTGLRTAEVAEREVVETLALTGTVTPVDQASVAFPTTGTVASVGVAVGDRVEVGQELATLATDELDAAVVAAEEQLALAELALEQALAGEPVTDAPSDGTTSGSPDGRQPTGLVPMLTAEVQPIDPDAVTDEEVAAAQQAVLDAAIAADDALATAAASLALATDVCSVDEPVAEDCRAALDRAAADQQAASVALAARDAAADALDALLARRASEEPEQPEPTPPTPSTAPGRTEAPSADTPSGAETGAPTDGVAEEPVTEEASAEEMIARQSAVGAAAAQVAVAQQALDQATIVSPLAGTVVAVGLAAGDEVTAGSTTATVTVVGDGGHQVTTTVAVDDLAELEVGQPATVAVDGLADPVTGEVVAVGLTSTEGDSGRVYPVTIGLPASDGLRAGTLADLSIALATSTDAVTVPASAIDLSGARATVTVVDDGGATSTVPVTLGAVGGAYVEVTGVEVGTVVVLADLSEPQPFTTRSPG